jgi:ABC-type nitrate/sulfonate/bicarbonate transport system permease component
VAPKAVIAMYLCFFPVTVAMVQGLRSPQVIETEMMHTYAASAGRPVDAAPAGGAAVPVPQPARGIAAGLVGAMVAELPTGAQAGLGARLLTGSYYGNTVGIWSALVHVGLLGWLLTAAVAALERLVLRHRRQHDVRRGAASRRRRKAIFAVLAAGLLAACWLWLVAAQQLADFQPMPPGGAASGDAGHGRLAVRGSARGAGRHALVRHRLTAALFGLWVLYFWQVLVVALFNVPRVLLPAPWLIGSRWSTAATLGATSADGAKAVLVGWALGSGLGFAVVAWRSTACPSCSAACCRWPR